MARVRVHPIQQAYTDTGDGQFCDLCGAEEFWTAATTPAATGDVVPRSIHLVHLVREHLDEVNRTLTRAAESELITVDLAE